MHSEDIHRALQGVTVSSDELLVLDLAANRDTTGGVNMNPNTASIEALSCFAAGWLSGDGYITMIGLLVLRAANEQDRELMESIATQADVDELDRADAACRRRPRRSGYDG